MHSYLAPLGDLTEQHTQCADGGRYLHALTDNWELPFLRTRTEGADEISDASAACVSNALADDVSRSMWITEVAGGYTDLGHLDPLFAVLDTCRSIEELDALDWN